MQLLSVVIKNIHKGYKSRDWLRVFSCYQEIRQPKTKKLTSIINKFVRTLYISHYSVLLTSIAVKND